MQQRQIHASILAADFARLGEEVEDVIRAGADRIHFDVMDNHFVPNLTFGPVICKALRNFGIKAPIDAHLMVEPVDELIKAFADAGATAITFHPQASSEVEKSITLIHELGCEAGIALNPETDTAVLNDMLDQLEHILIMSVHPGFGGQAFIPESLTKVKTVRAMIESSQRSITLAVDGGGEGC